MRRFRSWVVAVVLGAGAIAGCDSSSASSGDRVLVSKEHYETHIREPHRYDVVVFKFPNQPLKGNVPTNYIKRLLGLPGEIIAIFFGRLFRFAPPAAPPADERPNDRFDAHHQLRLQTRENDDEHIKLFKAGRFEILRKPPSVMMALRRIVYDNNSPAKDMVMHPRWVPATADNGWNADQKHGFAHAGAKAEGVNWLRYHHLLRQRTPVGEAAKPPVRELITDYLGYNSYVGIEKSTSDRIYFEIRNEEERRQQLRQRESDHTPSANWVGDLMLECQVTVSGGQGEFWLELSKGVNRFQARFDLQSGMCTLFRNEFQQVDEGGKVALKPLPPVELDSKSTRLRGPGSYLVRFANIDARLTVWVDRELPFGDGKDYPPPEIRNLRDGEDEKAIDVIALKLRQGPTMNDLEPASIGAAGAEVQVRDIRLWRDIYYTNAAGQTDVRASVDEPQPDLHDPATWRAYRSMPVKTLHVQPGHYLCLGDNSQASSDGRDWGLVPERLMLGRALLVYYPFNRAGPIR